MEEIEQQLQTFPCAFQLENFILKLYPVHSHLLYLNGEVFTEAPTSKAGAGSNRTIRYKTLIFNGDYSPEKF